MQKLSVISVLKTALVTAGIILTLLGTVNVNRVVASYNYNAYKDKKLEELKTYDPYATFYIEAYYEGCQNEIDASVDFDELIQLFKDYRERV